MKWSKLLDQYKFTIQYISKKDNDRANALSRRNDHMKNKKVFNHNILKVNKNESLSINQRELSAILKILKNNQKQFSIVKEKLHISKNKIDEIIKEHHNKLLQNHSNVFKTLQSLRQTCYFLNMRQHVEIYIKKCFDCQRNKHNTHVKYDEIQYQKLSKSSWNEIMMNFIIKLFKSKNSITRIQYDSILMMIDKLIKYSHIIIVQKKFTTKQFEMIILNRLIKYNEILKSIINDKDKLFTSNYWKTLISLLNTRLKMFIVYHSQTNDQTKRTNQSLEQYLRHYINNVQNNWVFLLSMTQLTFNFKSSKITKKTSFFANHEKKSNFFESFKSNKSTQLIMKRVDTLKKIHRNIVVMQQKSIKYQNKKRKMTYQLKEKDKIYLNTKNLRYKKKNRKRSKKFDQIKIESFFIKTIKKSINYELDLLKNVKVFSIFHISFLKSIDSKISIQNTFHYEAQKEDVYEVENILNKKDQKYLVKWKKYFISKNTWKSIKHLKNC